MALISTMPRPAQSATAAPDMPANIIELTMFTWARPPRRRLTRAEAKLKMRSVISSLLSRLPVMMKKGTASSAPLKIPSSTCWGRM